MTIYRQNQLKFIDLLLNKKFDEARKFLNRIPKENTKYWLDRLMTDEGIHILFAMIYWFKEGIFGEDDLKETIKLVASYNISFDIRDDDGNIPLHLAVETNSRPIVNIYLNYSNLNVKNNDNFTPLSLAFHLKCWESAQAIVDFIVNQLKYQEDPYIYLNQIKDIVCYGEKRYLQQITSIIDITNMRDEYGKNPLEWAKENNNDKNSLFIYKIFLEKAIKSL